MVPYVSCAREGRCIAWVVASMRFVLITSQQQGDQVRQFSGGKHVTNARIRHYKGMSYITGE